MLCITQSFLSKKNTKKIDWYLKKINNDAIAYILSIVNIHVTETNLKKHWALTICMDNLLMGVKKVENFDEMVKKHTIAWMINVQKLLMILPIILNPDYGDFLKIYSQMHAFCKRGNQASLPTGACGLGYGFLLAPTLMLSFVVIFLWLNAICQ